MHWASTTTQRAERRRAQASGIIRSPEPQMVHVINVSCCCLSWQNWSFFVLNPKVFHCIMPPQSLRRAAVHWQFPALCCSVSLAATAFPLRHLYSACELLTILLIYMAGNFIRAIQVKHLAQGYNSSNFEIASVHFHWASCCCLSEVQGNLKKKNISGLLSKGLGET